MPSEKLLWSDIVSPTMDSAEYVEKFKEDSSIEENYSAYIPKSEVINQIVAILSSKNKSIKILAMGAAWCKDCKMQVPHLLKIVDALPSDKVEIRFLYGIKTDPYRTLGDIKWSARHSPPEAVNPKFAVDKIPMIYFFDSEGTLLDLIEEKPKSSTIEEVLLASLKK
ncbi:MAG: hypothetical protein EU530_01085 [Promethearchaeota archaeon]|nr:MAG: hypothetical protein EU530_01085 [Candidatus Lokiarchaeota archaeon]